MKRKFVVCNRCKKEKWHFGLGMCSACLRRTKRETRPLFYLGTCYSELSRRIKTFDPLRPNYFGLEKCSKDEFITRFLNDDDFLILYKHWQDSNYKRIFAPSIDRINNKEGYILTNLQFISQSTNSRKDYIISTKLVTENEVLEFDSRIQAANYLNISASHLCRCKQQNKPIKGYTIV